MEYSVSKNVTIFFTLVQEKKVV